MDQKNNIEMSSIEPNNETTVKHDDFENVSSQTTSVEGEFIKIPSTNLGEHATSSSSENSDKYKIARKLGEIIGTIEKNVKEISSSEKKIKASSKIVALGASSVGKTSYLSGLFYYLNSGNKKSISEFANNSDLKEKIDLENAYSIQLFNPSEIRLITTYIDLMRNKNEPLLGTEKQDIFNFSFNFNSQSIDTFQWVDYRGGVLKENSANKSEKSDYSSFVKEVTDAEILCIFVNGDDFIKCTADDIIEYENSTIDTIKYNCSDPVKYFTDYYSKENKKQPPIAIIITKNDKVIPKIMEIYNTTGEEETNEKIYNIIKSSFSTLFSTDRLGTKDDTSLVGIFPISVITEKNGEIDFHPLNVQYPLYFAMCNILYNHKYDGKVKEIVFEKLCKVLDKNNDFAKCYLNGEEVTDIKEAIREFYGGRIEAAKRFLNKKIL